MATFFYSCKVAPLTEYEKIRANTMMRNNRMFQSLGLGNIVSMIRRSNGPEGSTVTSNDCSSAITQGSSSEYSPTQDEDTHQDEPLDTIVENEVKVQPLTCLEGVGLINCYVCLLFI